MKCVYCRAELLQGSHCHNCGNKVPSTREEESIAVLFKSGYEYEEILEHLKLDGIEISLSTLKRRLRNLGLGRNNRLVSQNELRNAI